MVRFLTSYGAYGKDDVAGFRPEHEQELVRRKIAERFTPEKKTETADSNKPDPNLQPNNRQTTTNRK